MPSCPHFAARRDPASSTCPAAPGRSPGARVPTPQFPYQTGGSSAAYRSSKTALNALTVYLYAQALEAEGFKVNALAPGLRATNLTPGAASRGGDPAEAAAGIVRLALLSDEGPTGGFFSWDR